MTPFSLVLSMKTLNDLHIASTSHHIHESIATLDRQMLEILQESDSYDSLSPCLVITAANYHLSTGGQRIRAVLALHAGKCLGLSPKDTHTLAVACELLHNASLIHDDLHDRDTHRRGQPSVWYKFGDEVAVCAGDLLLSASYLALSQLGDVASMPKLFALMHARIASAIRGQCADMNRPKHGIININDFKAIASTKSGALISLPTELVLVAAEQYLALERAREAATAFAISYQIHDDLFDVEADVFRNSINRVGTHQTAHHTACNIVLILQSDPNCVDARTEAKKMAFQHLSLAASACADLPLHSGDALHAMCLKLQDELECLE